MGLMQECFPALKFLLFSVRLALLPNFCHLFISWCAFEIWSFVKSVHGTKFLYSFLCKIITQSAVNLYFSNLSAHVVVSVDHKRFHQIERIVLYGGRLQKHFTSVRDKWHKPGCLLFGPFYTARCSVFVFVFWKWHINDYCCLSKSVFSLNLSCIAVLK